MRVLVDATAIPPDRGGVGRYVDELVRALPGAGAEVAVVAQERDVELFRGLGAELRVVGAPPSVARRPVRFAWEQTGLPRLLGRWRPDVVHSPHYTLPLLSPVPVTVTLHDATFFSHPELHLRQKAVFFRTATRLAVRRADSLVVPSAATRDAVLDAVGGHAERFVVAHHGVDRDRFHPVDAAERDRVRATLDVGDRSYVAFLGTVEPRKNVPALVRAWVAACAGLTRPPALVIAGGRGWDDDVDAALAAAPDRLVVRRPGYLPLGDLPGFLAGAQVVAYPSLGEGFGLPVLEAMACGATVLTSRELSLPEVGGDAVAYSGTRDDEIAVVLGDLLRSPRERERLARAAVERAARFTWAAAAERHMEAYRRAAECGGRPH